jgi:hypothetical protein
LAEASEAVVQAALPAVVAALARRCEDAGSQGAAAQREMDTVLSEARARFASLGAERARAAAETHALGSGLEAAQAAAAEARARQSDAERRAQELTRRCASLVDDNAVQRGRAVAIKAELDGLRAELDTLTAEAAARADARVSAATRQLMDTEIASLAATVALRESELAQRDEELAALREQMLNTSTPVVRLTDSPAANKLEAANRVLAQQLRIAQTVISLREEQIRAINPNADLSLHSTGATMPPPGHGSPLRQPVFDATMAASPGRGSPRRGSPLVIVDNDRGSSSSNGINTSVDGHRSGSFPASTSRHPASAGAAAGYETLARTCRELAHRAETAERDVRDLQRANAELTVQTERMRAASIRSASIHTPAGGSTPGGRGSRVPPSPSPASSPLREISELQVQLARSRAECDQARRMAQTLRDELAATRGEQSAADTAQAVLDAMHASRRSTARDDDDHDGAAAERRDKVYVFLAVFFNLTINLLLPSFKDRIFPHRRVM